MRLVIDVAEDEAPRTTRSSTTTSWSDSPCTPSTVIWSGTVAEVLHLPSQDLLAIRTEAGGEALVPFVSQLVPEVDLAARLIRIDPPPGLLDDAPED